MLKHLNNTDAFVTCSHPCQETCKFKQILWSEPKNKPHIPPALLQWTRCFVLSHFLPLQADCHHDLQLSSECPVTFLLTKALGNRHEQVLNSTKASHLTCVGALENHS